MKDLDFDELDKAVNSLMQTVPDTSQTAGVASPEAEAVALDIPTQTATPPVPAPEAAATPAVVPAPATSVESPRKPSGGLAEKRSGRFMDVMHPSSDMRSAPAKSLPATRQGVSLAPISPNVVPETPSVPLEKAKEEHAVVPPTPPAPAAAEPESKETEPADTPWPDPIDMHASLQEEPAPEVDTPAETDVPSSDDANLQEDTPEEVPTPISSTPEPEQASPFLADAKVEKRPLGGSGSGAPSSPPPAEQSTPSVLSTDMPDEADMPKDDSTGDEASTEKEPTPQVLLPAELGEEITAIEADNSNHSSHHEASETPAPASFISKQYKEKESSGDKEHAPIYDSNTQPLAHPAKKKSGWGAVVWILVIILVCVSVAAGLYFGGIIKLPV